jgi:hypothetical protein
MPSFESNKNKLRKNICLTRYEKNRFLAHEHCAKNKCTLKNLAYYFTPFKDKHIGHETAFKIRIQSRFSTVIVLIPIQILEIFITTEYTNISGNAK